MTDFRLGFISKCTMICYHKIIWHHWLTSEENSFTKWTEIWHVCFIMKSLGTGLSYNLNFVCFSFFSQLFSKVTEVVILCDTDWHIRFGEGLNNASTWWSRALWSLTKIRRIGEGSNVHQIIIIKCGPEIGKTVTSLTGNY